jgi:hypothetical protein
MTNGYLPIEGNSLDTFGGMGIGQIGMIVGVGILGILLVKRLVD